MKEISAKSGLNQNIINQINNIFAKYPQIKKVMLYGSRAKGNYKKGSDIDLSMLGEDLTYKIQLDVFDDLDELLLPYKIDLSVFDYLDNANLRDHIERVGVVFYEREISRLPKGWEMKRLGEVCELYQPKTISSKEMVDDGDYPVFGANGIIGKYDKFNHEEPQLLITCRGATCGSINISEPKSWINGNAMVVRPKDNSLNLKFIEYLFLGGIDISKTITGAAQPQITRQTLSPVLISYPKSLPEQQRIVAILDEAFLAINKAKANAEANLKNAKELFESYLQGVFENNGEGWEEKTLNEISENLDSKRIPITKNVRNEGSIPYYGASGIVDYVADYLFDEDLLCVSEDGANLLARTYPIAFSISGKAWVNNHAHVLRFKNMVSQKFVELYLNSIKLNDFVSGMAQPKLNQTMLNKIPIPHPPLKEQQTIVQKLDSLSTETKKLEAIYNQKINDLEELKKSVLQKAFSLNL
jgi:type I restriction enzyme S subunit